MEAELKLAQQRDAQERVWQQQQDKEQVRALYACLLSGCCTVPGLVTSVTLPGIQTLIGCWHDARKQYYALPFPFAPSCQPALTIAILLLLLICLRLPACLQQPLLLA